MHVRPDFFAKRTEFFSGRRTVKCAVERGLGARYLQPRAPAYRCNRISTLCHRPNLSCSIRSLFECCHSSFPSTFCCRPAVVSKALLRPATFALVVSLIAEAAGMPSEESGTVVLRALDEVLAQRPARTIIVCLSPHSACARFAITSSSGTDQPERPARPANASSCSTLC